MAVPALRPAVRRTEWPRVSLPSLLIAAAVLGAAANVAVTLVRLPALLAATYRFSDAPALAFYADALLNGHGPLALPTQTSVGVLWLDELITPFPVHHLIEYITGPAITLIAFALIVRSAQLVGGRRLAAATVLALALLPPIFLWPLLFPDNHATTVLGMAVLLWHSARDTAGRHSNARSVAVGLATGLLLVTDPQLVVAGAIPYLVTQIVMALRLRARAAMRPALLTVVAASVAVAMTVSAMRAQGLHIIALVPGGDIVSNLAHGTVLSLQTAGWSINGGWYGSDFSVSSLALLPVAAAIGVALMRVVAKTVTTWRRRETASMVEGYRLYWLLSMLCVAGAFAVLGYGLTSLQGHYLLPVFFAAAALLPTAILEERHHSRGTKPGAPRRVTMLASLVVAILGAHTAYATATVDAANFDAGLAPSASADPLPLLLEHGLSRGYSGYWEAFDLDWRGDGKVAVWPVLGGPAACGAAAGSVCAYGFAPEGVYRPVSGRTFIITPASNEACVAPQPSVSIFGVPAAAYRTGPYIISMYEYDVASRFSTATQLFC